MTGGLIGGGLLLRALLRGPALASPPGPALTGAGPVLVGAGPGPLVAGPGPMVAGAGPLVCGSPALSTSKEQGENMSSFYRDHS